MKILNIILCIGLLMNTAYSVPTWSSLNNFGGGSRFAAAVFVIGDIGYVGTGDKGTTLSGGSIPSADFWALDTKTGAWTQIANYGGGAKSNQVGFAIDSKGYVGVGNNSPELWRYTPSPTNSWTRMADLTYTYVDNITDPMVPVNRTVNPQFQGVAFTIGLKGYFRDGSNNAMLNKASFWEYDPSVGVGGTWTQKKDLESGMNGISLRGAAGFAINGKGYVGAGLNENNQNNASFYEYTPGSGVGGGSWAQKATLGGSPRINTVSFASSTKGYVGLGFHAPSGQEYQIWEFDPTLNSSLGTWTQLPLDFPGTGTERSQAVGFAVGSNLYVGTGDPYQQLGYNDFWAYYPLGQPVLPVELTTINATVDVPLEHVDVNWQTATEKESAYFAVERQSKTNSSFVEIGQVKGAGNSDKVLTYKYIDEKPVYGVSYYRLRLADIDGKITYSKTVSVSYKGGAKVKVFPTFTEGYVNIENGDKHIDGVYVWNASGQLMLQSKQTQLDLSDLPTGLYLVQVKTGGESFVQKITKR